MHELGADARILSGKIGERTDRLVLRRCVDAVARRLLDPVTHDPEQRIFPVLDPAERAWVARIDPESERQARSAKSTPVLRRADALLEETVASEPTAFGDGEAQKQSNTASNSLAPSGLVGNALDEAEQRFLGVLAEHGPHHSASSAALLALLERAAAARDASLTKAARRADGIVHTPVAVAHTVVREANAVLERLGLPGVGDRRLRIVDPAMGPGVFLGAVLARGIEPGSRLVGIDADPEATRSTRRALSEYAAASGARLELRVGDALAGPLDDASVDAEKPPPAVLILGNPPWRARGTGPSHVERLMADFRRDERGELLRERRSGVLADAYLRFLRWAIDEVERAREAGAIALVTSTSYLDGPVHRGVRAVLCARFDEVRVLDLGGSALLARDRGTLDANLFGVRPGAAILVAARRSNAQRRRLACVSYVRVAGSRGDKLAALENATLPAPTPVVDPLPSLRPRPPTDAQYERWPSLNEWLMFHAEGVQTNRDEFAIASERGCLVARLLRMARGLDLPPARPHFDPDAAARTLAQLESEGRLEEYVGALAYRPFDIRFAFLHPALCHRTRPPLLAAMRHSPLALVSVRKDRSSLPWSHVAVVRAPVDNCYLSSRSSCRARAFPSHRPDGSSNISEPIARALRERGIDPSPCDVVAYLAAVMSSETYARRFVPSPLLDYPRVPLPRDAKAFSRLVAIGRRLADVLMGGPAPVASRGERDMERVGHHAYAAQAAQTRALRALRQSIEWEP